MAIFGLKTKASQKSQVSENLESFVNNFENGFIFEDHSYALYKNWLLGEAVKILSSLKSDLRDQECWPLGDISL